MSLFIRAVTDRQLQHSASRSKSHAADKAAAERRRQVAFIAVPAAGPRPQRPLPFQGEEFMRPDGRWERCTDPEQYGGYLLNQAKLRSWHYYERTTRGKVVTIKRTIATPIEVSTTTIAPWITEWVYAAVEHGDVEPACRTLAAIRNKWLATACCRFEGSRHVIGAAVHWDRPENPHIDLALSKIAHGHKLVGKVWRCGPTLTALDRHVRIGVQLLPFNRDRFERDWAAFRARYGDVCPIDVQLSRDIDAIADELIGPGVLAPYKAQYARKAPLLAKERARAALAILDAERARLIHDYQLEADTKEPEVLP